MSRTRSLRRKNSRIKTSSLVAQRWRFSRLRVPTVYLSDEIPIYACGLEAAEMTEPEFDMHYALELGIIISGRMKRYYQNWETEIGPGQAWFCGMWEPHGWSVTTPSCKHLGIILLPEALLSTRIPEAAYIDWMAPFTAAPEARPQAEGSACEEVLAIIRRFMPRLAWNNPHLGAWSKLLALRLLATLQSGWINPSGSPLTVGDQECRLLNLAMELVVSSHRMITTEEAAEACAVSATTFRETFRKMMGLSFSQFDLRYRLSQAATQLLDTASPIATIASEWGFSDVDHLSRLFKQHYGVSPMAYRQRYGHNPAADENTS